MTTAISFCCMTKQTDLQPVRATVPVFLCRKRTAQTVCPMRSKSGKLVLGEHNVVLTVSLYHIVYADYVGTGAPVRKVLLAKETA